MLSWVMPQFPCEHSGCLEEPEGAYVNSILDLIYFALKDACYEYSLLKNLSQKILVPPN